MVRYGTMNVDGLGRWRQLFRYARQAIVVCRRSVFKRHLRHDERPATGEPQKRPSARTQSGSRSSFPESRSPGKRNESNPSLSPPYQIQIRIGQSKLARNALFSSALRPCVKVRQVGWCTRQFLVGQVVVESDPLGASAPSGPTAAGSGGG
jgi:hypothetical protein